MSNQLSSEGILDRNAMPIVGEALMDFRVVVINGARQSGKTVLMGQVHRDRGGTLLSFDEPAVLEAAISDPISLIHGFAKPLLIDEVQRAGDPFLRAIKLEVDKNPQPGQFLFAGSSRFLTVPTLSESLAGRACIVDLWPFSQGELVGRKERFIDRLFQNPAGLLRLPRSSLGREDYFERVSVGGFPEVLKKVFSKGRATWFEAYVRTVTQRDIKEISRIRQSAELPRLLRLLAALTGQELNVAQLARQARMDDQTLHNYLPLLETVYLIHHIPGCSRNLTSKVKRRAKIYLTDTGLASRLLGVNAAALAHPTAVRAGQLLETFVVNEIIKQRTWSDVRVELYHLRDRDGAEVDLILESDDGRIAALEVKAAQVVRKQDLRWLELLRRKLGSRFVHGVVLYTGSHPLSFGERLSALPASVLWDA